MGGASLPAPISPSGGSPRRGLLSQALRRQLLSWKTFGESEKINRRGDCTQPVDFICGMKGSEIGSASGFVSGQHDHVDRGGIIRAVGVSEFCDGDSEFAFERRFAAVNFVPEAFGVCDSLQMRVRARVAAYAHPAPRHFS